MSRRFKKEFQPRYLTAVEEYKKLGDELKQTTRVRIAEKFDTDIYAIAGIAKLGLDDFRLIHELLQDRREMIAKRATLRAYISS